MRRPTIQHIFSSRCRSVSVRNLSGLDAALAEWQQHNKTRRIWNRDATLWTGQNEARWLGWLDVVEQQLESSAALKQFALEVREAGFEHALLLGMGGSSLCAEVLASVFGHTTGFPRLHVLDSIDPRQVHRVASEIDPARTLFIVSSKSGTTLEASLLAEFFLGELKRRLGDRNAGAHFAAVTDPGTPLQQLAEKENFRWVFAGIPSIGGRFSALSHFGLVPAAAMGLDVRRLLRNAFKMVKACRDDVSPETNPGVLLGLALGLAAEQQRDKVTLVTSPGLGRLELWIEQLLAESTGKNGKGLIPVCGEPVGWPEHYGNDRVFCYLRDRAAPQPSQNEAVEKLEATGHPVIQIEVGDVYDLGQEFFRWEFATAVAASVLGVNPFDQPDVEAAKAAARECLKGLTSKKPALQPTPAVQVDEVKLLDPHGDAMKAGEPVTSTEALRTALRLHLEQLRPGDFFAVLAFVEMNEVHERILQGIRIAVRDAFKVATMAGFGPRYLHSTGQLFKGGSNRGVLLIITSEEEVDVQARGQAHSFAAVKQAQAEGDLRIMSQRGRRILRLHVGPDVTTGLGRIASEILTTLERLSPRNTRTNNFTNERTSHES
jgi:transaldolase/glucose-6-phosphate isomerase